MSALAFLKRRQARLKTFSKLKRRVPFEEEVLDEILEWLDIFEKSIEEQSDVHVVHLMVQLGVDSPQKKKQESIDDSQEESIDEFILKWRDLYQRLYNAAVYEILQRKNLVGKTRVILEKDFEETIVTRRYGEELVNNFLREAPAWC